MTSKEAKENTMKTTYREMKELLSTHAPFEGNSVHAISGIRYEVYSYETLIYRSGPGRLGYFDNSFYSMTTSKLQNMLIDVFGLNDGKKVRA